MSSELTTAQAAAVLGVHTVTLRKWRAASEFIGSSAITGAAISEDCQGLQWWYKNDRCVMYDAHYVERLKRILSRRKGK